MSEQSPLPYTVSCCDDCAKLTGLDRATAIAGTIFDAPCQLCGKEAYLREYRTGITAAAIRDDMC